VTGNILKRHRLPGDRYLRLQTADEDALYNASRNGISNDDRIVECVKYFADNYVVR
jgi:hypothetical protein